MKIRLLLVACAAAIVFVIAAGGTWRFGPRVSPLLILNRSDQIGTLTVASQPDLQVSACSFVHLDLSPEADWVFVVGRQTIDSRRLAASGQPRVVGLTVGHDGGVSFRVAAPDDANGGPSTDPHPCAGEG